jgi:hypothetical protein
LIRVESVIQANRGTTAIPWERFLGQVLPAPDFMVTIGEPPTAEADGDIGLRSDGMLETKFAVDIRGGHRQS